MDIPAALVQLQAARPVFHSESDFQFALAWQIKSMYPDSKVRLEVPMSSNETVDLLVRPSGSGSPIAIELKYPTRKWEGTHEGEAFSLRNHSALDHRRYDIVKDIQRVERFVTQNAGWSGYVMALTNDAGYWSSPRNARPSNDQAFRIHDGVVLGAGPRGWVRLTASTAGRRGNLELRGDHEIRWAEYAKLDESSGGTFRSLVLPVPPLAL